MSSPSEQAKQLGLIYAGFGGWLSPESRKVVAKTVNGQLVRVISEPENIIEENLGKIAIIDISDDVISGKIGKEQLARFIQLIKAVSTNIPQIIFLYSAYNKWHVAKFLNHVNINPHAKLLPIGNMGIARKQQIIMQKVNEGYSDIEYFDSDPESLRAIQSLKIQYNKQHVIVNVHQLPISEPPVSNYSEKLTRLKARRDLDNIE